MVFATNTMRMFVDYITNYAEQNETITDCLGTNLQESERNIKHQFIKKVKYQDDHLNIKLQKLKRFVFDHQCALIRSLELYLLFVLFLLVCCSCTAATANDWGTCG